MGQRKILEFGVDCGFGFSEMKEVREWMERAEKDLKRAKLLFDNKDYEGCAFHSHQAAEKALKALYILKFKRLWKIHDLKLLAEKVEAPTNIVKIGDRLNPYYIEARHLIKAIYTKQMGSRAIKNAKIVVEWVKERLQKK